MMMAQRVRLSRNSLLQRRRKFPWAEEFWHIQSDAGECLVWLASAADYTLLLQFLFSTVQTSCHLIRGDPC